jgi:hypothetical protein
VALAAGAGILALWALAGDRVLPAGRAAWLAAGGLAGLCAWVWASSTWAPLADVARGDAERVTLYLVALLAGAGMWSSRRAARAVEPVLAAGAVAVAGYGLAGRLLPGVVDLQASSFAGDRLFQPLGYWNALGALMAASFVLCAHMAGDRTRRELVRVMASAGAVPIGVALYLTLSRGALGALVAGLIVLLSLAPTWSQLRAVGITVEMAALAVAVCAALPAVRAVGGDAAHSKAQGAVALVALLALMLVGALMTAWAAMAERDERTRLGRLPLPPRAGWIAGALAVAVLVVPVLASGAGGGPPAPSAQAGSARLGSIGSNRGQYWTVALREATDHPLAGVGAGGFRVSWLRERHIDETVRDAHSLYLETAAELGLVGLLLLGAFMAGVAGSARIALRDDPALVAGPVAALAALALHAGIDWDWEMPATTLPAITLAAMLLARARPAD